MVVVDLLTLAPGSPQVCNHVTFQNLFHRRYSSATPAAAPPVVARVSARTLPLSRWIASSAVLQRIDREAQRVRKLRIQQQEFQDPLRRQVRRIHLAVRLKRRRRPQQPHPVKVLVALRPLWRGAEPPKLLVVSLQQRAVADARSMYRPTWMNCHPSPWLIVESVTPWNWCTASITCVKNSVGCSGSIAIVPASLGLLHLRPGHLQVKAVQPMPLLGRDLLPHMPRVLPRRHSRERIDDFNSVSKSASAPAHTDRPPTSRSSDFPAPAAPAASAAPRSAGSLSSEHQVQVHDPSRAAVE